MLCVVENEWVLGEEIQKQYAYFTCDFHAICLVSFAFISTASIYSSYPSTNCTFSFLFSYSFLLILIFHPPLLPNNFLIFTFDYITTIFLLLITIFYICRLLENEKISRSTNSKSFRSS